jgi:DNA-binding transcriptional LysR family regulator
MTLSTRDFTILSTLAREQHFGRAAEALGLRQPQLSIRVAEIERQVGVRLFTRRPRVALTAEGEIIVDAARAAFGDFAAAVERAGRMARGQEGTLVVAVASSVMLSDIPLSIQRFRRAWPDVEVVLRDMHSARQLEALRAGQIDLAITRELGAAEAIASRVIGHQRFVVLLPKTHPLAGRGTVKVADLANEPFVLFAPGIAPGLLQQIHQLCARAGFEPRIAQQAEEWYTVLGFVRAGFGITIALDIFGPLVWPDLAMCPITDDGALSPVYVCWSEVRAHSPRDLLIDWLQRETPSGLTVQAVNSDLSPGG